MAATQTPKRILLLITQMEPGGAQKAMLHLAVGLRAAGYHVTVVTMYDKQDFVPRFEQRYGLPIRDLGMKAPDASRPANLLRMVRGWVGLVRLMQRERVQIVQTYTHYSNVLGCLAAWVARVPVRVASQRGSLDSFPGWFRWLDRQIVNRGIAHRMVAVSQDTHGYCVHREGMNPQRVLTIRNGIHADPPPTDAAADERMALCRSLGVDPDTRLILTVARLHEQKGHRYLIEAVPRVMEAAGDACFLLAGDGELRDALTRQAASLPPAVAKRVRFLGFRDDVPRLMRACDLFVLPSLWEGMPNVVLEAMLAGKAVVATPIDGTPELAVDGQTALLIPPRDPDALARAMIDLLNNPARRAQFGQAGRQRVLDGFLFEHTVEAYLKLYESLSDSTAIDKRSGEAQGV